jgi:hypothetical protein
LPASVGQIDRMGFANCSSLKFVTLTRPTPPAISNGIIFSGCGALTAIYVPAGSVAAYKAAGAWNAHANKIQAIQP